jgi:type I restriction enzyme S subunit
MSWERVELGEVVTIDRKGISADAIRTGTLYVGLEHITGEGKFDGVVPISKGDLSSTKYQFDNHHVLYGKLRPYLRKIARPEFSGVCSTDILPLHPKKILDRGFLFHYLRQPEIVELATTQATGINLPRISPERIKEFLIPLPPLAEQRRIAAILDKAYTLRQQRRTSLEKLDVLLQSIFLDMFGDPVTNPRGWERRRLDQCGTIVTGNTPSRERDEYYGEAVEWIKSDNINTPYHYLTRAEECLSELGAKVGRTVPKSSILVTCIAGSPSVIGNVAMSDRKVAFNQQINALIPHNPDHVEFLYTQFLVGKRLIQRESTNSMKGMVSKSSFSTIEFIYPPDALQQRFCQVFRCLYQSSLKQRKALTQLDTLFHALQQRAFRGDL